MVFCGRTTKNEKLVVSHAIKLSFLRRRAHTQSTKQWLSILDKENVPVLICLTFADKLFAELMGESRDCDLQKIKLGVEEQLNVCIPLFFFLSSII